jgi:hypothetical protein
MYVSSCEWGQARCRAAPQAHARSPPALRRPRDRSADEQNLCFFVMKTQTQKPLRRARLGRLLRDLAVHLRHIKVLVQVARQVRVQLLLEVRERHVEPGLDVGRRARVRLEVREVQRAPVADLHVDICLLRDTCSHASLHHTHVAAISRARVQVPTKQAASAARAFPSCDIECTRDVAAPRRRYPRASGAG